jgi:hypothetical protein
VVWRVAILAALVNSGSSGGAGEHPGSAHMDAIFLFDVHRKIYFSREAGNARKALFVRSGASDHGARNRRLAYQKRNFFFIASEIKIFYLSLR